MWHSFFLFLRTSTNISSFSFIALAVRGSRPGGNIFLPTSPYGRNATHIDVGQVGGGGNIFLPGEVGHVGWRGNPCRLSRPLNWDIALRGRNPAGNGMGPSVFHSKQEGRRRSLYFPWKKMQARLSFPILGRGGRNVRWCRQTDRAGVSDLFDRQTWGS